MDGFKNSTRIQYDTGAGYAKGGAAKVGKVMGEFASGKLHSGSKKGPEVTSKKQAVAIALSEARKAGAKIPVKKAGGGAMTEMDRRMGEEDVTRGFDTKPPVSRKIKNAKDAAPKREPMIVAKKTTVAVVPKNANPIERLLAVKPGMPLKKGGKPAAYKMGGKVMRKADGGNVNLAGAVDGQPVPAQTQSASQAALQVASNGAPMPTAGTMQRQVSGGPVSGQTPREIAALRASYDDSQGARPQVSRGPVMGGINKGVFTERAAPTQSLETQRQVSRGPVMGAANTFMPTQSGGDFNENGGRMQSVMPSPVLGNRQNDMQERMQDRMGRREERDQRRQGMMDMMDQRRQGRFGPPSMQSNINQFGPTQPLGLRSVSPMSPEMAARLGQANQTVSNVASNAPTHEDMIARYRAAIAATPAYKKGGSVKGSKIPVSEKATGETYVSKKAMMKHEASEPRAVKMAEGEIRSKKQTGGMATSVHFAPEAERRDRAFVEARGVPMREMVGKSAYKKGGKTPC